MKWKGYWAHVAVWRAWPIIAHKRATAGYTWLKEHGSTYGLDYTLLDPSTLSIVDFHNCPLAQVGQGPYGFVIDRLFGHPDWVESPADSFQGFDWLTRNGFDISVGDSWEMYGHLTQAWRTVITQDRIAGKKEVAA